MSILTAVTGTWALLLGIAFIMVGNGLQGTLLGLRASLEGFPTAATGVVMTGYYVGFVAGSSIVPKLLKNVGHIRVFAAMASIASGAVLLHGLWVHPAGWTLFRLMTGFCFAGLFVVTESWLNDAATNRNRGQLLSVYMVLVFSGMGTGQYLLLVADPLSFELFIVVSLMVSFALVPIVLSVSPAPRFEAPAHLGWRALYAMSPLGVAGAVLVGMAHAALFAMTPVYAGLAGLSVAQISVLMSAALAGGMILQWPIGWISDRFDRRTVITVVTFVAALAALAAWWVADISWVAFIACAFLFGGLSLPLYSLCIAHVNDYLEPEQIVSASATVVLVGGIGLCLGPLLASAGMSLAGPEGLFIHLAAVHASIGAFALYRMTRRSAPPLEDQRHYEAMSPRTSPIGAAIAMRQIRDAQDRDLARRSNF